MPRIPPKNPRFRSKQTIASDIAHVLNAPLSWGTQYAVLAEACWVWSEFDGKYKGCRYWSDAAWKLRNQIGQLRHDHLVPKKLIIDQLAQLRGAATSDAVFSLLDRFCIGVVITVQEDQRLTELGLRSSMPAVWDGSDPWARYSIAGINLQVHANEPAG